MEKPRTPREVRIEIDNIKRVVATLQVEAMVRDLPHVTGRLEPLVFALRQYFQYLQRVENNVDPFIYGYANGVEVYLDLVNKEIEWAQTEINKPR